MPLTFTPICSFVYLFSLITNMSQTLLFSVWGQRIQDRSVAVADAAFGSGWYRVRSRRLRQALIMVMQRAQRKVKISAGGFIDLSFESFLGVSNFLRIRAMLVA